jgi:ethanolamine utilization protein EutN
VKLARVIGTVVASRSTAGMEGIKLLVVQPLGEDRHPRGRPEVAADATAQAGTGQLVFTVASREGAQAMPELFVPVDLAITGLVDDVHLDESTRRSEPTAVWRRGG